MVYLRERERENMSPHSILRCCQFARIRHLLIEVVDLPHQITLQIIYNYKEKRSIFF